MKWNREWQWNLIILINDCVWLAMLLFSFTDAELHYCTRVSYLCCTFSFNDRMVGELKREWRFSIADNYFMYRVFRPLWKLDKSTPADSITYQTLNSLQIFCNSSVFIQTVLYQIILDLTLLLFDPYGLHSNLFLDMLSVPLHNMWSINLRVL